MIGFGKYFMKKAPKEINSVFGYRTSMSMKNKDTWEFAHKYCGKVWYVCGMVMLPITVIFMLLVIGKNEDCVGRMGGIIVHEADLEESVEVVIAGYQKKNAVLSDQEKKVVAYHEIGHALVAALQSHSAPVQKITIIPRTSGALGYTMQVEQGDKYLMTKEEIENKIATFTGGRAAEEVVFNQITTGASNDIEQATKLARAMITRYGMSDEFDMVALETVTNQYLGGDASLACSADTQKEIDRQVKG